MNMIKERIRLLQIIPRKNIPSVIFRAVRRIFIKRSYRKVRVPEIDKVDLSLVFSSSAAQVVAELFDDSKPLEEFDEIPIFGNPEMSLRLDDLIWRGWEDIQLSSVGSVVSKDRRFIWEISRLQFLPLMARYIASSNSEAGHILEEQLLGVVASWRSANRFPLDVNWESPLEVAIRLMNILVTGAILSRQGNLGDAIKYELSGLLSDGFGYLQDNLEFGDGLPSNHLIVEACILYIVSRALSLNETAHRALKIIEETLENQVSIDGLLLESSLPYAVFVLEAYLLFALVYGMSEEIEADPKLLSRAGEMYDSLASLVGENLIVPSMGDDDSARVLRFDSISTDEQSDRSYLRKIYDEVFSGRHEVAGERDGLRGRFSTSKTLSPDGTDLWVDEEAGFGSLSRGLCRVVFRFPGSREFKIGSHAHSDYLSFCLYFKDRKVFGDPGSFLYSDHEVRVVFRSEESHSTISLQGYPQREYLKNPFISFANSRMVYDLDRAGDSFRVGLFFRERRGKYARVERLFTIADDTCVRITDFVYSNIVNLNLKWSFILSSYLRVEGIDEADQQTKSVRITGDGLKVIFKLPALFDVNVDEIKYSRYYGHVKPSQRISLIPESGLFHSDAAGAPTPLSFEVRLET
ncbi:MAG: heparinase II/III-family protein [Actinobacteria bacterium]|nr:heparinase II/III-family protein [Actinomycetota bacterium]